MFYRRLRKLLMLLIPLLLLAVVLYPWGQEPLQSVSSPVAIPASAAADWGLSFPQEGKSPVGNATTEDLAQYNACYLGDTSKKVIYLTFDCGYENGYTEPILDALKRHNAPAAFFVVGNLIESDPDLIRRMAADGHIVGNHTYHHPDMSAIADQAVFQRELESLSALYREATGEEMPRFYRPPQGKYSRENLRQAQELIFDTDDGGYNIVTVQGGKIAVTEANCPDQYCVKQGFCNSGKQIVCLPHKLVITFLGESEIDGAVGMYSGIFNNPFMIWGRYRIEGDKALLPVSFQFHHTQMDGAHAGRFLENLQNEINRLK